MRSRHDARLHRLETRHPVRHAAILVVRVEEGQTRGSGPAGGRL